jgi:hypothetical protein
MTFARIRLVLAAVAFVGWLAYLGYAVSKKGTVQIVSRAQLTAATCLVVAKVESNPDGTPSSLATVVQVLGDSKDKPVGVIEVLNLPSAATPLPVAGESRVPPAGEYLIPLVKAGEKAYRVAGLPKSPGVEAVMPDRPLIYPWADDVRTQLRTLGLLP